MSSSDTVTRQRDICCCGAGSWTKVIAWLQILFSGFLMLYLVRLLSGVDLNFQGGTSWYLILIAAYVVLEFFMGIILLKGAMNRKPMYLCVWRAYVFIFLCMKGFVAVMFIIEGVSGSTQFDVGRLVFDCLSILISSFFFWIVGIFLNELEQHQVDTVNEVMYRVYV